MRLIEDDKEFKSLLLKELVYFDDFCTEHNISYYLFYGSMLGAARHGGFIPWDDDVDLVMPRKDYLKLVAIFNLNSKRYKLVSMHNTPSFTAPLAKIIDTNTLLVQNYGFKENVDLGIYIDVFILDGLPSEEKERIAYMNRAKKLSRAWMISDSKFRIEGHSFLYDVIRYIYRLPYHIFGYKYFLNKIDRFSSKYDFYESEYVTNLMLTTVDFAYRREDFQPIRMPFEGKEFVVPKGYKRLLRQRYGEWEAPPEVGLQKSHHKYECYIINQNAEQ